MTVLAKTIAEVRRELAAPRREERRIGLVPTMGALHAGHKSLLAAARDECDVVVASIFVNPTQFGPGEDYEAYPRPVAMDLAICRDEGVDVAFAPSAEEMYPEPPATTVHVAGLTETMCGATRPGHFDGVTTVVAKLLNIVGPDAAYFGEKDAQQLAVVRRMVRDLNLPVEIRACPLVRESDGLAVSSRNQYLSDAERARALVLSEALAEAEAMIVGGERDGRLVARAVRERLEAAEDVEAEYAVVVDPDTLEPLATIEDRVLVAVAARVGPARLIDNIRLRGLE